MAKIKKNTDVRVSFAGANTGTGFRSFYSEVFPEGELSGLYIIKGGPGTGKSTFMRQLGDEAKRKGFDVEYYLCGSDSGSLDGVKVVDKGGCKIGVLDGTPPHPREFISPGAAGDILDFGMFWDSRELRSRRGEIDGLAAEKSSYYTTAYRYLGAADRIGTHITEMIEKAFLREKAAAAAGRFVQSIGREGKMEHRQLSGITMDGPVQIEIEGTVKYAVVGDADIGRLYLREVERAAMKLGFGCEVSMSPIDFRLPDSIYFPETRSLLYLADDEGDGSEKRINMRRFVDRDILSTFRQKLRFGKKCRDSLVEGAVEALTAAKEKHFTLEKIYGENMDFDALREKSGEWRREILSRLDSGK